VSVKLREPIMDIHKTPQLRIVLNTACGKSCSYCRPTGEAATQPTRDLMMLPEIVYLADLISGLGVRKIKLTGGDPALYRDIIPLVTELKRLTNVTRVELITRHHRCGEKVAELQNAGLDQLNFSLDSLDSKTWSDITGVRGHQRLVSAIEKAAASGIPIKINMVVLKGINDNEIPSMIEFCRKIGAGLKLLDLISDITEFTRSRLAYASNHYDDLVDVITVLQGNGASPVTSHSEGGLGHPMATFHTTGGPPVRVKTAHSGAWYGDICRGCPHFPCHDALMALRLTPDGKLQRCLLRSDNLIDLLTPLRSGLGSRVIRDKIVEALATYRSAQFYDHQQIMRLRADTMPFAGSADHPVAVAEGSYSV